MSNPAYLVNPTFLGRFCGAGVNPDMRDRLADVEADLRAQFDALAPEDRDDPNNPGQTAGSFEQWCGLLEPSIGFRHAAGFHASGSALDMNTSLNPYIVTRSGSTLGGEAAGAALTAQRQAAVEVYDRAAAFTSGSDTQASVGVRGAGESTADVYDRFAQASGALKSYFGFAFKTTLNAISRRPVPDVENASNDDLDAGIPGTERLDKDTAIAALAGAMGDPNDVEAQYYRILRDYELVRVPFVNGNPSAAPASTRNPAKGFLWLRREVVVSMCDTGRLRWGICDFGVSESGDGMHFDMHSHGNQNQFKPG